MSNLDSKIAQSFVAEQRRTRIWKNIRFIVYVVLLIVLINAIRNYTHTVNASFTRSKPYAALVKMNGVVGAAQDISASVTVPLLQAAFRERAAKAVVLEINSPGGSPVQAQIIYNEIRKLKKQYKKPVIAVGEDVMASAAYLIASAADQIVVSPATITGSIGVLMEGFGFTGLMDKIGVQRRLFTAGTNKARLDPFSPLRRKDIAKVESILQQSHQIFINDVEQGRGKRLKGDPSVLFSGDFWLGEEAIKLGLADGLGDIYSVQKKLGIQEYETFAPEKPLLQRLTRQASASAVEKLMSLESRAGKKMKLSA